MLPLGFEEPAASDTSSVEALVQSSSGGVGTAGVLRGANAHPATTGGGGGSGRGGGVAVCWWIEGGASVVWSDVDVEGSVVQVLGRTWHQPCSEMVTG